MNFSEKLDQFVERGAEKVPSALLNFKECTCENPDWGQCPYHDQDYDVVFGYNNCADSLGPIVLKLYNDLHECKAILMRQWGTEEKIRSLKGPPLELIILETLSEVEKMIEVGNA